MSTKPDAGIRRPTLSHLEMRFVKPLLLVAFLVAGFPGRADGQQQARSQERLILSVISSRTAGASPVEIFLQPGGDQVNIVVLDSTRAGPRDLEVAIRTVRAARNRLGDSVRTEVRIVPSPTQAARLQLPARLRAEHERTISRLRAARSRTVTSFGRVRRLELVVLRHLDQGSR